MASKVLSFATIAGGVWVEDLPGDHADRTGAERCFRFDSEGRAEWCPLAALWEDEARARWYGHQLTAKDFILC